MQTSAEHSPNFGRLLYARMKWRLLLVSALSLPNLRLHSAQRWAEWLDRLDLFNKHQHSQFQTTCTMYVLKIQNSANLKKLSLKKWSNC